MHIGLTDILVCGLAAYAINYVALDAAVPVAKMPREAIRRWAERHADRAANDDVSAESKGRKARRAKARAVWWGSLVTLLGCSWCFGFWCAAAVTAYFALWVDGIPGVEVPLLGMGAWIVCGLVAMTVDTVQGPVKDALELWAELHDPTRRRG